MSADAQLAWARLILRTLVQLGVRHAVFSPGSRSTPLVLSAESLQELHAEVFHDERVAGFHALGRARASGEPTLLVCTSGTAAAHYYPAVIEASRAGHPLVVLSADRPPERQGREASQTIDQRELFGVHVKRFVDLGCADLGHEALLRMRGELVAALELARAHKPGPVHFNAGFRKPFEPTRPIEELEQDLPRIAPKGTQEVAPPELTDEARTLLKSSLERSQRPLFVVGPARLQPWSDRKSLLRSLDALEIPFAAEPASQLRFVETQARAIGHAEGLFEGWEQPDLVVQLGQPPTSGALERALAARDDLELLVIAGEAHPDPTWRARAVVHASIAPALEELSRVVDTAAHAPWRDAVGRLVASQAGQADDEQGAALDDLSAMRVALDTLPPEGYLALGNSLPVRVADLVAPASGRILAGVLVQRGAAGIDGLAASAAGSAAELRAPLLLAYGDVSFAHDLGGLLAAARASTPLVLLVLDNRGGRIFDELPVRNTLGANETFSRYFLTRPDLDILEASRACGVPAEEAHDVAGLRALLERALEREGASVVVARIDEGATRRALAAFRSRLGRA